MKLLAIDPGNIDSAYVILEIPSLKPLAFGKVNNNVLLEKARNTKDCVVAIEMIASYGMAVGKEVFDTCVFIGQLWEAMKDLTKIKIYRKEVKINLCGSMKAKDGNIRLALIDRFS